jgi:hypothetical protein
VTESSAYQERGGEKGLAAKGTWSAGNVLYHSGGVITWLCFFVKTHQVVHLKYFIPDKLHLIFKKLYHVKNSFLPGMVAYACNPSFSGD